MTSTFAAVDVCNSALQMVGSRRIADLTENSREAEECSACYDSLRRAELRKNVWRFATVRASLAALSTAPLFGRTYQYLLPADYLRMAPKDPRYTSIRNDHIISKNPAGNGLVIETNEVSPLQIRYVQDNTDVNSWDSMFFEGLACRIASKIIVPLQQSSGDLHAILDQYKFWIDEATRANAIEIGPTEPQLDDWIAARDIGSTVFDASGLGLIV